MSFIFEGHLVEHTGQMSDKIIQSHGHRAMLNLRFLSHEHRKGASGTMGSLEKRAGRVLSTRPGHPTNNGSLKQDNQHPWLAKKRHCVTSLSLSGLVAPKCIDLRIMNSGCQAR